MYNSSTTTASDSHENVVFQGPKILGMSGDRYEDIVVKIPPSLDTSSLAGKSVLITGGASGLGKAYTRAFSSCGAYITIADYDKQAGMTTMEELKSDGRAQFQQCDVTDWDSLARAFEAAVNNSPNKGLDVVIANAGIVGKDDMFALEDPTGPPMKPDLKAIEINLMGVLYTTKLAFHYLRRQPISSDRDRCLILKSSLAGYFDLPGSVQYQSSKFGVRGLFRTLRNTSLKEGIRVNLVAPWYAQTRMLPPAIENYLTKEDIGCARVDDCCKAMLVLASDKSIHGRALGVVPRQRKIEGVMDLELDDYAPGSMYQDMQRVILEVVENFQK